MSSTTISIDNSAPTTPPPSTTPPPTSTGTCTAQGVILREEWKYVGGSLVSDLTSSTAFKSAPSSTSYLSIFEGPVNSGDNYGDRISGYICVPLTGKYIFRISGDDNCELWLSKDSTIANIVKIATVPTYTSYRNWYKFPEQTSDSILLVAGQKYYIESLHKEGGGSDNVSVGWELPNGVKELPIPGNRLSPRTGARTPAKESADFMFDNNTVSSVDESELYPNPAKDNFSVAIAGGYTEVEVLVSDAFYRTIKKQKLNVTGGIINVDVSEIPNGSYFVTLITGEQKKVKKLVIHK